MRSLRQVSRLVAPVVAAAVVIALTAHAATPTLFKIETVARDSTPWGAGLVTYEQSIEKATANGVDIKLLLGSTSDEQEIVLKAHRGVVQGMGGSTGALATIVPELNVLEMPYTFASEAEADYVLDKVLLPTFEKLFRDRGLVLGFWSENGYRSFGTNFGPVHGPADLKGHKMRCQENPVHLAMYRALGASPVPIAVTEVGTSLATGAVDGWDNTALYAQSAFWVENTKYYTLSKHIYQPAAIIFNRAAFDALPAETQKMMLAPRGTLDVAIREEIRGLDPLLLENFGEYDVEVYQPTAAEIQSLQTAANTGRDTYIASASAGEKAVWKQIQDAIKTYRASPK